jgi:integrase
MFLFKNKQTGRYYLYYFDISGKRKCITTKAKYKPEAMKFLKEFNINQKKENKLTNPIYTLSDLKNEVLKYATTNFDKKTVWEYSNIMTKFIYVITDIPLKDLTVKQIEFFKSERLRSVKPATLNKDLGTLKSAFNYALRLSLINENPFNKVNKISLPDKERLSISYIELNSLLGVIDKPYFRNIVLFAVNSGLRQGEIINLQWKDIDFNNLTITIRNKATFKTKSGKMRIIPLTNKLRDILKDIAGNSQNVLSINTINPENYVFRNIQGYKYSGDYITHLFKRYSVKAGLPEKFHFHCLRHTYITNMIKAGININYVKELAGHSTIQTTMIYTHIGIEDLKRALINF